MTFASVKWLKTFFEKIDYWRDRILFAFIKKYWPRNIEPNHLTSLRIIIALAIVILLLSGFRNKTLIISLFIPALLLDMFDGSVARALNKKTRIGAVLDPIADKILILPVAIYSLWLFYFWLLFLVLLTEALNALTGLYLKNKGVLLENDIFGKAKMVAQSFAFGIILITWPLPTFQIPVLLILSSIFFGFLSLYIQLSYHNNQYKI